MPDPLPPAGAPIPPDPATDLAAPAAPENPPQFNPIPDIRAWTAALQLAAVLATVGFVARFAREQLLGISLGDWTAQDLSQFAGRFALDTVLLIFRWITEHSFLHSVVLILLLIPGFFSLYCEPNHVAARITRLATTVLSGGCLLFVLVSYEIPATALNGWLATSLSRDLESTAQTSKPAANASPAADTAPVSLMARGQDQLQLNFFLSKSDNILLKCAATPGFQLPGRLAALQKDGQPTFPQLADTARGTLRFQYVACTLLALVVGLTFYLQPPYKPTGRLDHVADILRFLIAYLLLPLATLLVPYMYGKLVDSTVFFTADVQFEKGMPDPIPATKFVVQRSDKEVSLLYFVGGGLPHVDFYPRDKIYHFGVYQQQDVLQNWIESCDWAVAQDTSSSSGTANQ